MEHFGDRLTAIRQELGLSQIALAKSVGISQPQLSKLEKGTRLAGAEVIDKIAAALQRNGLDLVRGTDREGAYTAARLAPEDQRLQRAMQIAAHGLVFLSLRLMYDRVIAVFDAMYGGGLVSPGGLDADPFYLELRKRCEDFVRVADSIGTTFPEPVYFPDHLVPESDMDDLLLAYEDWFRPEMQKTRRMLLAEEVKYRGFIADDARALLIKQLPLKQIDEQIAIVTQAKAEADREFKKYLDRIAAEKKTV